MKKPFCNNMIPMLISLLCAAAVLMSALSVKSDIISIAAASALFPSAAGINEYRAAARAAGGNSESQPAYEGWISPGDISSAGGRYAVATDNSGCDLIPADNRGPIEDAFYGSGSGVYYLDYLGGNINNKTGISNERLLSEIQKNCGYSIELNSSEPQVLIYHTHATESFDRYTAGYYDSSYPTRSSDNSQNMVGVGAVVAEVLNAAGINTLQSQTQHDYQYNGSYARSRATIEEYLTKYPSIKVVLDLHRDGIESEGIRYRPIVLVDGIPAAQFMIISAADEDENRWNYYDNLRLAARIQSVSAAMYPGLARPVSFKDTTYNQDMSRGALLIEVGSHGNSLTEALYTGYLLGQVLVKTLTELN